MTHVFGKKLRELRKAKGFTQQELVDIVNTKYGTATICTAILKLIIINFSVINLLLFYQKAQNL